MPAQTYYEILEVAYDADEREIRRAYRQKIKEQHPDQNPDDPRAIRRTRRLNEARDTLLDPDKRRRYDKKLRRKGIIPEEPVNEAEVDVGPVDDTSPSDHPPSADQSESKDESEPDEYTFAPEYEFEQPTAEPPVDGFYSYDFQETTSAEENKFQTAWTGHSRSRKKTTRQLAPVQLVRQFFIYSLAGVGGLSLLILMLWIGFGVDLIGLFQNRNQPIAEQTDADGVGAEPEEKPTRVIPPPLRRETPKNDPTVPWDKPTEPTKNEPTVPWDKPTEPTKTEPAKDWRPTLTINKAEMANVAISPDGRLIASTRGNLIELWDAVTGVHLKRFRGKTLNGRELTSSHQSDVKCIAFSPDGKLLASGGGLFRIKLWDVSTGIQVDRTFDGDIDPPYNSQPDLSHGGAIRSIAFSPNGTQIISGSEDKTLKLWDTETGTEIRTFGDPAGWARSHEASVLSVAFSPDGKQLISGSFDKTIKLWDAETGAKVRTYTDPKDRIHRVAFCQGGQRIVSSSDGGRIKFWDVQTGKELDDQAGNYLTFFGNKRFIDYSAMNGRGFAVSPNGQQIVSSFALHVCLWDAESKAPVRTSDQIDNVTAYPFYDADFSADGTRIVTGSGRGRIHVWDVKDSIAKATPASGAIDGDMGAKNAQREPTTPPTVLTTTSTMSWVREVYGVAFSPDSKTIVSGYREGNIKLWDVQTGKELKTLRGGNGHKDHVLSVAFSPDGKWIVSGSTDNTIKLWDAQSGEELKTLTGHVDIRSVAVSPDGQTIASGGGNNSIKLWNVQTGKELKTLTGHTTNVRSVAFSPDGQTIASGSADKTIKLWDVQTGREINNLTGHTADALSVAFSPDGQTIASGSADKTIKLWDARTGKELKALTGHKVQGLQHNVHNVAFSPDGQTIASGSADKTIKLWDARTGKELKTLTGHTADVYSVAFSPDGQTIASGSQDKTIRLWHVGDIRDESDRPIP